MSELYFLRHGSRIDHALLLDANAQPLTSSEPFDPSISISAIDQLDQAGSDIINLTQVFDTNSTETIRKNIFIHFSPYLRCCQSADVLVTNLKLKLAEKFPNYKIRFQLLGDFALSEWIHDKMKNKPPFIDSNDAYQMYTPNIKTLVNKNLVSNFRPTNSLGPFNGPELSYKDYQSNCKKYFQKLVATYDKPNYIKNKDIIIVVSHGYVINNFISYFTNHPIFDEIPEAKVNYAARVMKNQVDPDSEEASNPENYNWRLFKDALLLVESEDVDSFLNLDTDIVYYKTNFIKRDEFNEDPNPSSNHTFLGKPLFHERPRPSFKIESSKTQVSPDPPPSTPLSTKQNHENPKIIKNYNPICPAARDWTPQLENQFKIKSEFQLKVMHDEDFRQDYSITNHPQHPISPDVSPNSKPTRNNSVIDLSKLIDNDDIYKPMKLKYSTASEIPIHKLNSKVNSQVNLAAFQRSANGVSSGSSNNSSNEPSYTDLPGYLNQLQQRKRSSSNPINVTVTHNAKDSYFPSNIIARVRSPAEGANVIAKVNSAASDGGSISSPLGSDSGDSDLDIIKEFRDANGPPTPGAFEGSNFDFGSFGNSGAYSILSPHSTSSASLSNNQDANRRAAPQQFSNPLLNRATSLKYKRNFTGPGGKSLLAKYQQQQQSQKEDSSDKEEASVSPPSSNHHHHHYHHHDSDVNQKMFSLSFNSKSTSKSDSKITSSTDSTVTASDTKTVTDEDGNQHHHHHHHHYHKPSRGRDSFSSSESLAKKSPPVKLLNHKKPQSIFYSINFDGNDSENETDQHAASNHEEDSDSDESINSEVSDEKPKSSAENSQFIWFGNNR